MTKGKPETTPSRLNFGTIKSNLISFLTCPEKALPLLAFLIYVPAIGNGWSFDDDLINGVGYGKGLSGINDILTSYYFESEDFKFEYRPVARLTLALECLIFGENAHVHHFFNAVWYAALTYVLYVFLLRISNDRLVSGVAVLLYVIHPIHTEVVASLKNREELFSLLFALLSVRSILKWADGEKLRDLLLGYLWFLLALLSKKSCLPFVFISPLTLWVFGRDVSFKKMLASFSGLVLVTVAVVFFTWLFFPGTMRPIGYIENPIVEVNNRFVILYNSVSTMNEYFKLSIFPYPLSFYYGYNTIPLVTQLEWWVVASFILYIAALVFSVKYLTKFPLLCYSIIIYLLILGSMYSSFIWPATGIISERALFVPSLAFCIVVAMALKRVMGTRLRSVVIVLVVGVVLAGSTWSVARSLQWKSGLALMERDIQFVSNSAHANVVLGEIYWARHVNDTVDVKKELHGKKAERYFLKALAVRNNLFTPNQALGVYYSFYQDNPQQGLFYSLVAYQIKPTDPELNFELGTTYVMLQDWPNAVLHFQQTLKADSLHLQAYHNLFLTYLNHFDDPSLAQSISNHFLKKFPNHYQPYLDKAFLALKQGDMKAANEFWQTVMKLGNGQPEVEAVKQQGLFGPNP